MIQKVSFRNFKAYRSLDLELEPFTVLVGPNASGKTTLLEGLRLTSDVAGRNLEESKAGALEEVPGLRSYGVGSPVELSVSGVWGGTKGAVRLLAKLLPAADNKDELWQFSISGEWGDRTYPLLGRAVDLDGPGVSSPAVANFRAELRATTILRFEPWQLAGASYSDEPIPYVRSDGGGLASVLAYLKLERDEVFDEIELALKQIVPTVRRIRIERAVVEQTAIRTISLDEQRHQVPEKRTLWGNKVVLDMRGAKGVPASAAGEGTLMALGLLTVLMGPMKPRLVLLDDIELGLHPSAQGKLIEVLRKIQVLDPELQIIATSHSPFILNYLDPKEVRMTFLAENGFARCEKLTAHPEFERWKDLMSPGEFWSTVGESWLEKAGETPVHE